MTTQSEFADRKALLAQLLRQKQQSYSFPLSYGQQALWVIYQDDPTNSAYNMAWAVEFAGKVDVDALRKALQTLIERHAALRTTLGLVNGEPMQTVQPHGAYDWTERLDMVGSEQQAWSAMQEVYARPFDLDEGPVLRAGLFRVTAERHVLLLVMHHLFGDADAMNILGNELLLTYQRATSSGQSAALPAVTGGYADFVRAETAMMEGPDGERLAGYWKSQLQGDIPLLNLPTDYPRPSKQTYNGSSVPFALSGELGERLRQLAKQSRVTLFTLFLSAFQVLLHRYTGQPDIWIGTPSSVNRRQPGFAHLVGYLANSVVLRTTIDETDSFSFRDLLERNRTTVLDAIEHSVYPFLLLVKTLEPWRASGYSPLFHVMLDFKDADFLALAEQATASNISRFDFPQMEGQFDLTLNVVEGEPLACRLYYNTDLFTAATIERMAGHLESLLSAVAADAGHPIATLPLLSEEECRTLQTWSGKLSPPEIAERLLETEPDLADALRGTREIGIHLLDAHRQLVPIGVVGRIHLCGLVAEGTVSAELHGKTEQLLATTQSAKWHADGRLECVSAATPETAPQQDGRKSSYVYPRDQLEFRLGCLWQDLLDVPSVSVVDDFFDLGGDSLLAIRLIFAIEKAFGVMVSLQALIQNSTLEKLACLLREGHTSSGWSPLVCLQPEGESAPLFFVHASGGSAFDYFEIAMLFGTQRPFYAIQPRGIDLGDPFHATIEEMAADYVTAIRGVQNSGPYFLAGWSFGGTVAFEMARILEQAGETVAFLAMIDTPEPSADVCKQDDFGFLMDRLPYYYGVTLDELDVHQSDEEKVAYLLEEVKLSGLFTPDIDQTYAMHWFEMYKHHNKIVASYTPGGPIKGPIDFFRPSEKIPFDVQMGNPSVVWRDFALGSYRIHDAPGNHFNMVSPLNNPALVRMLEMCLAECAVMQTS